MLGMRVACGDVKHTRHPGEDSHLSISGPTKSASSDLFERAFAIPPTIYVGIECTPCNPAL